MSGGAQLFDASFLLSQTITQEQYEALEKAVSELNIIYIKVPRASGGFIIGVSTEEQHGYLYISFSYNGNFQRLEISPLLSVKPKTDEGFATKQELAQMEARLMELINAKA